jgi:uncharacterized lipoprotein YbaY
MKSRKEKVLPVNSEVLLQLKNIESHDTPNKQ